MKEPFKAVFDDYLCRINKKFSLIVEEFDTRKIKDESKAFEKENEWLVGKIKAKQLVNFIGLDKKGKNFSSEELSSWFENKKFEGKDLVFIIGGSHGLNSEVLSKCNTKISFSKMTFPHLLFRVLLVEQVYRAISIYEGAPYHK